MTIFSKTLAVSTGAVIACFLSTSSMASPGFSQLDANGDGALELGEFASVARAGFDRLDANGDSLLSHEELMVEAQRRAQGGNVPPRKMVKRLLKARDANGDGALSFPEMVSGRVAAVFRQLDADGNHLITLAEWSGASGGNSGRDSGEDGSETDAGTIVNGGSEGGMDLDLDDPQTGPTGTPGNESPGNGTGGNGSGPNQDDPQTGPTGTPGNESPGNGTGGNSSGPSLDDPQIGPTGTPGNQGAGNNNAGNGNPPVQDPEPDMISGGGLIAQDDWIFGG